MPWRRYSIADVETNFDYAHGDNWYPVIEISIWPKPYHLDIQFHDIDEQYSENFVHIDYQHISEADIWNTLVKIEKTKDLPSDLGKKLFEELIKPSLQSSKEKAIDNLTLTFYDL